MERVEANGDEGMVGTRASAELLLGLGVLALILATALVQFVMIGLVGVALLPAAVVVLAAGLWRARDPRAPLWRRSSGAILLVASLGGLAWVCLRTSDVAYLMARHEDLPKLPGPDFEAWLGVMVMWLGPALLAGAGLRLWAGWTPRKCLAWALLILAVCPLALLLFSLLHPALPVSA